MIKVNDRLPNGQLQQLVDGKAVTHDVAELFANKTSVVFALPGAFTPTCSVSHLPGYVVLADEFHARGVDQIICLSVNDAFVMDAWGKSQNASQLLMLADGNGSFVQALGLANDTGLFGGLRSQRFAMVVDNGELKHLAVEAPKSFEVSKADVVINFFK